MVGGEWVEVVRRRHRTSPAAAAAVPPAGRPQHVQPQRAAPGGSAPRGGQQAGQRQYSRPAVRAAAAAAASPPIPVQPLVIRDLPPHSRVLLKACIPAGFSVQHALSQLAPAAIDAVNSLIAAAGGQDAQSSGSDVVVGLPFAITRRTGPGGQRVPVAVAVAFTLPPSTGSLLLSHGRVALPDPWPASEPPALLTDSKPPAEQQATLTGVPAEVPAAPFVALFRQTYSGVLSMSPVTVRGHTSEARSDTYQLVLRPGAPIPGRIPLKMPDGSTQTATLRRLPLVPLPRPKAPPPAVPSAPAAVAAGAPAAAAAGDAQAAGAPAAAAAPPPQPAGSEGTGSTAPTQPVAAGTAATPPVPALVLPWGERTHRQGRSTSVPRRPVPSNSLRMRFYNSVAPRVRSASPQGRGRAVPLAAKEQRAIGAGLNAERAIFAEHARRRSPYAEEYEEQTAACASSAAGRSPCSTPSSSSPQTDMYGDSSSLGAASCSAGTPTADSEAEAGAQPSIPSTAAAAAPVAAEQVAAEQAAAAPAAAGQAAAAAAVEPAAAEPVAAAAAQAAAAEPGFAAQASAAMLASGQRSKGKRQASNQPEQRPASARRVAGDAPDGQMPDAA